MSELCTVVNVCDETWDVYIGRGPNSVYGNPFTHIKTLTRCIIVPRRADAVLEFGCWLDGDPRWASLEPQRRAMILANLPKLIGKRLGCYCAPLPCHGDVLARKVNALTSVISEPEQVNGPVAG